MVASAPRGSNRRLVCKRQCVRSPVGMLRESKGEEVGTMPFGYSVCLDGSIQVRPSEWDGSVKGFGLFAEME